jgi:hypothetical protein
MYISTRMCVLMIGALQVLGIGASHCGSLRSNCPDGNALAERPMPDNFCGLVTRALAGEKSAMIRNGAIITYPYDETVFPPEIAAPWFEWKATASDSSCWLIRIELTNHQPILAVSKTTRWMPESETWETIKAASVKSPARFTVFGFNNTMDAKVRSQNSIRFRTSTDRVNATVLYRQVPLPFRVDTENFKNMKWRLGDIASNDAPPVVMENLSVCASCHLATKDGSVISMEMNYQEDSGRQLIAPIKKRIHLSKRDFMTWSDFPKPEILPPTRGLFAKISPSGKYLVGTVNEISYSAQTADKAFSQLFFPTYGILAWYKVAEKKMNPLPGADNTDFVQTDPSWRWDEQEIAFARAKTHNEYLDDITTMRTRVENVGIDVLNQRFPIQYNLYKIPFNQGRGGSATPIKGASFNGMSNYFPRYSPNGKWIVFTMSKSGIMLQPDSALYIVPAKGGTARRMRCNLHRLNSWHSFSPNGKWMLFTSKTNSPFTEILLTHIDADGNDTKPVRLSRFSDNQLAANVPEFVNIATGALRSIRLKDEHNAHQ